MNTTINVPSSTPNAQQQFETFAETTQTLGRKGLRTYLGLLGMAYDTARYVLAHGPEAIAKVENRGEAVEKAVNDQMLWLEKSAGEEITKWRSRFQADMHNVTTGITKVEKLAEEDITQRVEKIVGKLRVIFQQQAENVGEQITITESLTPGPQEPVIGAEIAVPMPDYNAMTAKEIIAKLTQLSETDLESTVAYERTHLKRVTVLRAAEELLEKQLAVV